MATGRGSDVRERSSASARVSRLRSSAYSLSLEPQPLLLDEDGERIEGIMARHSSDSHNSLSSSTSPSSSYE